jgi:hypothetical protein
VALHAAGIAQLVERNLAKVEVASSNLVSRSIAGLGRMPFAAAAANLTPRFFVIVSPADA